MFTHVVLFWLKKGTAEAQKQRMIDDCAGKLAKIPTVRHIFAGRPAMTPREVADNSYDFALAAVFDDAAGHDTYQVHPVHKKYLEEYGATWDRVRVYDFK